MINLSKIKLLSNQNGKKQIVFKKFSRKARLDDQVNKLMLNASYEEASKGITAEEHSRQDDNVTSVKRSNGLNRDRKVNSPYVDNRESAQPQLNKLRQERVLKNTDNEFLEKNNGIYSNQETIEAKHKIQPQIENIARTKPGTISNQLQKQRWKSTLQGRGMDGRLYMNRRTTQAANARDTSAMHNGRAGDTRSASFQPSVIRRREGNKLKEVDLESEMIQNIKLRRQRNLFVIWCLEEKEGEVEKPVILAKQIKQNNTKGVKKIILKQSIERNKSRESTTQDN